MLKYLILFAIFLGGCSENSWFGREENKIILSGTREKLFNNIKIDKIEDSPNLKLSNKELLFKDYKIPSLHINQGSNIKPFIDDENIWFIDKNYNLFAYNYIKAKYLFKYSLKKYGDINQLTLVKYNDYYVLTINNKIILLHDDQEIWNNRLTLPSTLAPAFNDKQICVLNIKGDMECFAVENGAKLTYVNNYYDQLIVDHQASPVFSNDGNIIIPTFTGYLIAYDMEKLNFSWQINLADNISTVFSGNFTNINLTPLIYDDIIVANNFAGGLYGVKNGELLWKIPFDRVMYMLKDRENILVVDNSNNLYAINHQSGKIIWQKNNLIKSTEPYVVASDKYIATYNDKQVLSIIDKTNGSQVGKLKMKMNICYSLQGFKDKIYIIGHNNIREIIIK